MTVRVSFVGIGFAAQLHVGDVFEPQDIAVGQRADDDLAELFGGHQSSAVFHRILERVFRIFTQHTGRRLYVLFGQRSRHVRGDEPVLRHHVGFHPDTHRVVRAQHEEFADALRTQDAGLNVDLHVVRQEGLVVAVVGTVQRKDLQHGGLTLHGRHADLGHFGGQRPGGGGHAVLYVHGRHVGVGALAEIDRDGCAAGVGGAGFHIHHVLHAVDRLLERYDHALLDRFSACARIGGAHHHRRGCDVRILLHGQRGQADDAAQHDDD